MGVGQGVVDRVGQQWVRTHLDERGVVGARGRHGLRKAHRVAQVGHPVLGVEEVGLIAGAAVGGDDDRDRRRLGTQIGQFDTQVG